MDSVLRGLSKDRVVLYHRTTEAAARAILAGGFRDAEGHFGMYDDLTGEPHVVRGVWLSDRPLSVDQFGGYDEETLLRVTLAVSQDAIAPYEIVEEGKGYREWVIPAAFLTSNATAALPGGRTDG